MKKALFFVLLLTCLSVLFFSCSYGKKSSAVKVTGEVSREIYDDMGRGDGFSYPMAYHIDVNVLNEGNDFSCEAVTGIFYPEKGKKLSTNIIAYDTNYLDCKKYIPTVFKKNILKKFDFTTGGYTFDLLTSRGNKPLRFALFLISSNNDTVGLFESILPPLDTNLPYYELIQFNKKQGKPLIFKKL